MPCAVTMSTLPPPIAATPGLVAEWQPEFMQVESAIGPVTPVCLTTVVAAKLMLSWQAPQASADARVV